jgi:substrate-binding family protein/cytochrome c
VRPFPRNNQRVIAPMYREIGPMVRENAPMSREIAPISRRAGVALLAGVLLVAAAAPQVERGRRIYREGVGSAAAPIVAVLGGAGGARVPAATLPCAGCHGRDRRGKPEGGVVPPEISWRALTDPDGAVRPDGRRRPPYTERLLKRAIAMGIDAAGEPLGAAMPRYQMSQEEMADLLTYLAAADAEGEPGVSAAEVAVGVLLPPRSLPEVRDAVRAALAATLGAAGAAGGIYGRRVAPRFVESPEAPAERGKALGGLARDGSLFALLAPFADGADEALLAAAAQGIPVVGPLLSPLPAAPPAGGPVFFLEAGLDELARPLAWLGAARQGEGRGAIVHPDDPRLAAALASLREEAQRAGGPPPFDIALTASPGEAARLRSAVARLAAAGVRLVHFLGPAAALPPFLTEAARIGWHPQLLAPGPLSGPPAAAREARAAALLFLEAVRRTGRDLTREGLLQALAALYRYETGETPAVTFGPSRRFGIHGTQVRWLAPGQENPLVGEWIDLD